MTGLHDSLEVVCRQHYCREAREVTFRAEARFWFNQSIITYFYIIITPLLRIITVILVVLNLLLLLLLPIIFSLITSLFSIIMVLLLPILPVKMDLLLPIITRSIIGNNGSIIAYY